MDDKIEGLSMDDKNDKGLVVDDKSDEKITDDDNELADDDKRQGTESGALSESKG